MNHWDLPTLTFLFRTCRSSISTLVNDFLFISLWLMLGSKQSSIIKNKFILISIYFVNLHSLQSYGEVKIWETTRKTRLKRHEWKMHRSRVSQRALELAIVFCMWNSERAFSYRLLLLFGARNFVSNLLKNRDSIKMIILFMDYSWHFWGIWAGFDI